MSKRIVIVGGGIAGLRAAQTVRRADGDARLIVVSEDRELTYSACAFAEYIAGAIRREDVFLKEREGEAIESSEWMLGQSVDRIDLDEKALRLKGGERLPFDRLILATGSKPIVPRWPGVEKEGVHALKTFADADRVSEATGKDAVVVGAGPVGLEVAVALRSRGWNVSVIELLDTILPRLFAPDQSRKIHALLEEEGIRLLLGERVERIEGGRRVESLATNRRTLDCQLAIVGIGMRPAAGLARDAGLSIGGQGGIAVDPYLRTSHQDVFACGDCVESIDRLSGKPGLNMLWGNAKMQGEVAGGNSLGFRAKYPGALNITTLRLRDTTATSVGEVSLPDVSYGETIRRQGERSSIRLVVRDRLVKGIQAVGPRVDTSVFLRMMLGGERLDVLRESRNRHSLIRQKPWLVRLPGDLRE